MKFIIKFAIVFIVSFLCFNQGMNDLFSDYIITKTNMLMIITPVIAVMLIIISELFRQLDEAEEKSGNTKNKPEECSSISVNQTQNQNQTDIDEKKRKAFLKAYNELNSKLNLSETPYLDSSMIAGYLRQKADEIMAAEDD